MKYCQSGILIGDEEFERVLIPCTHTFYCRVGNLDEPIAHQLELHKCTEVRFYARNCVLLTFPAINSCVPGIHM